MSPAKKKAAKKKSATVAGAIAPGPVFLPDARNPLPSPRSNDDLLDLLERLAAFAPGQAGSDISETRLSIITAFSDDEYASLWSWAREVEWAVGGDGEDGFYAPAEVSVRSSRLHVPPCFTSFVDEDLASIAAMLERKLFTVDQLVYDDVQEEVQADYEIVDADEPLKNPLLGEDPPAAKRIEQLTFETTDDVIATSVALTDHIKSLRGLAAKLRAKGKSSDAKELEKSADDVEERLASQLKAQTALQFNASESLLKALSRVVITQLRWDMDSSIRKNVRPAPGEKLEDAIARAKDRLVALGDVVELYGDKAAVRLLPIVLEAAQRGKQRGQLLAASDPSDIAREAVQAVAIKPKQDAA